MMDKNWVGARGLLLSFLILLSHYCLIIFSSSQISHIIFSSIQSSYDHSFLTIVALIIIIADALEDIIITFYLRRCIDTTCHMVLAMAIIYDMMESTIMAAAVMHTVFLLYFYIYSKTHIPAHFFLYVSILRR